MRVIGMTTTGKRIYLSPGHPSHSVFTAADHHEAERLHTDLQWQHIRHERRCLYHCQAGSAHARAWLAATFKKRQGTEQQAGWRALRLSARRTMAYPRY